MVEFVKVSNSYNNIIINAFSKVKLKTSKKKINKRKYKGATLWVQGKEEISSKRIFSKWTISLMEVSQQFIVLDLYSYLT